MEIKGNTFIVTGSSSGLGAATASMLVEAGGYVLLADIDAVAGKALATRLGESSKFQHTDVTDPESAQAAIEAAQGLGNLVGLINCAGICPGGKILGKDGPHDLQVFVRAIHINLIGSFNMLRLAAAAMAKGTANAGGERGVVINTASIAAFDGQIGQAAYAASKSGVVGLTLPAARELGRHGIRVMAIAPGFFETPMVLGMPSQVQESWTAQVPFPSRYGRPPEFAQLCRSIIENPMLNGETIRLDGAVRMAAK